MEEQTSWKGHSFTLLVFTGIVVMSSIFFILGMLVGRAQGQKLASVTPPASAVKADAKPAPAENKPDFTFYDSVKKEQPAVLQPAAPVRETPPPPVTPKAEHVLNYQIGAVRKPADAEKLLGDLKKKGFRAFILFPAPNDASPYFRVQVGPLANPVEAQDVKKKLEAAGYQPILKK